MVARFDRFAFLPSPAFIAAVALLLLNDFILKPVFHNALTGKLSDFAGLFALTLFIATLWPPQRRIAAWAIAAAFTFWKTRYAEPLIESLNAISPFPVGRTVDLTDLIALPMIALAVWAAPRLEPWPLPRALQLGLALLAPLAFTATSRRPDLVRATLDVSSAAVVDEAALRAYFDEVAQDHGLRCRVCDSLDEGRIYWEDDSRGAGPDQLTVNLDPERRQLFYTTSSFGRKQREAVLALSEDIRTGMQQRFPDVTAIEFADDEEEALKRITTLFTVNVPTGNALSVETAEQAKRTLSLIVEDVVRTHRLRVDADELVYYAGRRFGASAHDRDLILTASWLSNSKMSVRVARQTENYAAAYAAISEDLAARLDAAFGSSAVTREDFERN